MPDIQQEKAAHLVAEFDLDRPELATVREAGDAAAQAAALVEHLETQPRPRGWVEITQKPAVLDFLSEHYDSWKTFDTSGAQKFADMTQEQAQGGRATSGISALGKAWWATDDPAWGEVFERFYLNSQTGDMFNWGNFNGSQPKMELPAYLLLQDCPGLSMAGRIAWLDHLIAICHFAWDDATSQWSELSLGPEGHNWYIHGMHALPTVGLLFPELKRAEFFRRVPWSMVEEHLRGHYQRDGGARETTLGYQAGTMSCLWDIYIVAHRNGYPMSTSFVDTLMRATHFILKLAAPNGGIPSFGDGGNKPGNLTALAALAAAATGDGLCKGYAEAFRQCGEEAGHETPGQLPESAFWNAGLAGAATYAQARAKSPLATSVLMKDNGYLAMRDGGGAQASYLGMAAAERGPIVTSHGHNDIFAIEVHAGGQRWLGEMGCAPYGTTPGRDYDQLTQAHNTLSIEGMEQLPIQNEWRWHRHLRPAIQRWISTPTHDFVHGVHEGFYNFDEHQTLHARKVLQIKPNPAADHPLAHGYWLVFDWLRSNTQHNYRVHFHASTRGDIDGNAIALKAEDNDNTVVTPKLVITPPDGGPTPVYDQSPGLAAYREERKLDEATTPAWYYPHTAESCCLVWLIAPLADGQSTPTLTKLPVNVNGLDEPDYGAVAIDVEIDGFRDRVCLSHKGFDADLQWADERAFGFLAIHRYDKTNKRWWSHVDQMVDGDAGR